MRCPLLLLPLLFSQFAAAQELTLRDAVKRATERYPSVQVSLDQVAEAAAGINVARTAYLPRAEMLGQINRATANNVFGLLLPQTVVSPISGPLVGGDKFRNVWGTAAGLLISWEPFDFGRRQAEVDIAGAAKKRAEAGVVRTQLEVATATADAYLTALAAAQTITAAEAGITRTTELSRITEALVQSELRPGADLARLQSETVMARSQVIRAREALATALASLQQLTGDAVTPAAVSFAALPPAPPENGVSASHPLLLEQQAAIDESKTRQLLLDKSWYPRFNTQANVFGRGSGTNLEGPFPGGANGLAPNVGNWAIGATVTFPLLEYKTIRARRQVEQERERRESSRRLLLERELSGSLARARAAVVSAREIAVLAPQQVSAWQQTLQQATARYRAGLGNITDVAETQRLLMQAESDNALAILNVWRAELALAAVQGDLEPFLSKVP